MQTRLTFFALAAFLFIAACSLPTTRDEEPDVTGVVLYLLPDHRALIESSSSDTSQPATFFVNPPGAVWVREGRSLRWADESEIRVGDRLDAWLMGVELRSLPPQYPARRVEIEH
jgi:hypothetical protein